MFYIYMFLRINFRKTYHFKKIVKILDGTCIGKNQVSGIVKQMVQAKDLKIIIWQNYPKSNRMQPCSTEFISSQSIIIISFEWPSVWTYSKICIFTKKIVILDYFVLFIMKKSLFFAQFFSNYRFSSWSFFHHMYYVQQWHAWQLIYTQHMKIKEVEITFYHLYSNSFLNTNYYKIELGWCQNSKHIKHDSVTTINMASSRLSVHVTKYYLHSCLSALIVGSLDVKLEFAYLNISRLPTWLLGSNPFKRCKNINGKIKQWLSCKKNAYSSGIHTK